MCGWCGKWLYRSDVKCFLLFSNAKIRTRGFSLVKLVTSFFDNTSFQWKRHLQSQMEGEPQISATLLLLQPACECTGH